MSDFQNFLSGIVDTATEESIIIRNSFDAYYNLDPVSGANMVFSAFGNTVLKHRKEDVVTIIQLTYQNFLTYLAQNPERAPIVEAHADGIQSILYKAYEWLENNPTGFIFASVACKPPEAYGLEHFSVRGYFSDKITNMPDTPDQFVFVDGFRFNNAIIPMDMTKYKE